MTHHYAEGEMRPGLFQGWSINPDVVWKTGLILLGLGGVWYSLDLRVRDVNTRVGAIEDARKERSAAINERLKSIEQRIDPLQLMLVDIANLKQAREALDNRMTSGREERVKDIANIVESINKLSIETALNRQEVSQLRQALEGQKRSDAPPFKKPMLEMIPAPPPIMKASAPMAEAQIPHRSRAVRFTRRSPVILAELTRSLERSFGRPTYRGPYFGSFRRKGMIR